MGYSFTEKKRIRKNFGKFPSVMTEPYLLAIQVESYKKFLQLDTTPEERATSGLHGALLSVIPEVLPWNMSVIVLVLPPLTSKSASFAD